MGYAKVRGKLAALGLVLVGGVLGMWGARLLAEGVHVLAFYRWPATLGLALVGGVAVTGVAWWRARRVEGDEGLTDELAAWLPFGIVVLYLFEPQVNLLEGVVLGVGALVLSIGYRLRDRLGEALPVVGVIAFPLMAYLATLTPAVGTRDGFEFQAISATLGFAHPTGYPLFPILGYVWIHVFPVGSVAWRINVLCALFAALSIPLVYLTGRRVLGRRSTAWVAALTFAFSLTLWNQATQPEKYTLNVLFVALILYLAFGLDDPEAGRPYGHLRLLAFCYGLSLTHHRTMLMFAPALAVYLLWRDPGLWRRPREWLPALGYFAAPLLLYLYIPWRAYAQGWQMTLGEFLRYISGAYYGPAVHLDEWLTSPERNRMFARFVLAQFGGVGVGLAVMGGGYLWAMRRRRFLVATLVAYFVYYVWGIAWHASYNDVNSFLPNHLLMALWIGAGVQAVLTGVERLPAARIGSMAVIGLAMVLPLRSIWVNAPQVDHSRDWGATRWGTYVMGLDLERDAVILADREKHPPLDYFARVEGWRPDLDVVILGDEALYRQRLGEELGAGRTVYLARFLPGLEGIYHLRSKGPLVEVGTEPLLDAEPSHWVAVQFEDEPIRLLGYDLDPAAPQAGDSLFLTLYWQADGRVSSNYRVRLRLDDAAGTTVWSTEAHPVAGMYPTAAWKPPEVIPDTYEIPLPATLPPGRYSLSIGLFPPFATEGLLTEEGVDWVDLTAVEVGRSVERLRPEYTMRALAGDALLLVGYDLPEEVSSRGEVPLTLYWMALRPLEGVEVTVTVEGGTVAPGALYSPSTWPVGEVVATSYRVRMPAGGGEARLLVRVEEEDVPLTWLPGWLRAPTDEVALPPVSVTGLPEVPEDAVSFADRILLLDHDLRAPRRLRPGDQFVLRVRWQCLQEMEEDYTVFVHLLGPDGRLHGQIDAWPLDGVHPTSQWKVGEIIDDVYAFYIDADAPAGEYVVEVGWYLLRTMQRLPIVDAEGRPVQDHLALTGVTVE